LFIEAALNGTDPVVFFESQRINDVGEQFHEDSVPAELYEITILTVGATLYRAMDAAKKLSEKYGMEAEVINLHCAANFILPVPSG